ncbi:Hypothetical predicted protein [Xyrichtys novacula]|uniref:Uncharacterized protein n=1 Tax=Xyrichtys novacula TaxID=13765 RepID=A0AAV1GXA2_XYRNO|nr:Hypothetical predicted protein [Xyrichtys novacula]
MLSLFTGDMTDACFNVDVHTYCQRSIRTSKPPEKDGNGIMEKPAENMRKSDRSPFQTLTPVSVVSQQVQALSTALHIQISCILCRGGPLLLSSDVLDLSTILPCHCLKLLAERQSQVKTGPRSVTPHRALGLQFHVSREQAIKNELRDPRSPHSPTISTHMTNPRL